jgi:excisionase family DNA binding protein
MIASEKTDKVVMTVPQAGARLGLGRNSSYCAAARGEIPTIRIGRLLRVPVAAFNRMLERAGEDRGTGK